MLFIFETTILIISDVFMSDLLNSLFTLLEEIRLIYYTITMGVGQDMSCTRKLFLHERNSLF